MCLKSISTCRVIWMRHSPWKSTKTFTFWNTYMYVHILRTLLVVVSPTLLSLSNRKWTCVLWKGKTFHSFCLTKAFVRQLKSGSRYFSVLFILNSCRFWTHELSSYYKLNIGTANWGFAKNIIDAANEWHNYCCWLYIHIFSYILNVDWGLCM